MILTHRIRLVPNTAQEEYFRRACGVARFAYNWALVERERRFAKGELRTELALRRAFNAIKDAQYPWVREVTKCAPQQAIKNLGRAYDNYFTDLENARRGHLPWKRVRKPRLKRKGKRGGFRAHNGPEKNRPVRTDGNRIKLPKIGWIKMRESVRFCGPIISVYISQRADHWYASVAVKVQHETPARAGTSMAGCDLGVTTFATIYDGCNFHQVPGPKPFRRLYKRVRRLSKSLSRKVDGSRNWAKAKTKLARLQLRIAYTRGDALHKLTTSLVRDYRFIAIEELNVRGMLANRYLARAVNDIGFGEFRRQLRYKSVMCGSTVAVCDRWFPSSKLCSHCNAIKESLSLAERRWTCTICAAEHDREENAARNIYNAASSAVSACGALSSGFIDVGEVKLAAMKQEGLRMQTGTDKRS